MMSGFSSLFTVLVTDPDAAAAISLGMLVPSLLLSLAATLVIGFIQMATPPIASRGEPAACRH